MGRRYVNQIIKGCGMACNNPFCNVCRKNKCTIELSNTLSQYDDIFMCHNIRDTIASTKLGEIYLEKTSLLLGYFFFATKFSNESDFHSKSYITINDSLKMNGFTFKTEASENNPNKHPNCPYKEYIALYEDIESHKYCKAFAELQSEEINLHLLEGVFYLMLDKFNLTQDYFLKAFIIRLFNILCNYKHIKTHYIYKLALLFYDMQSLCNEIKEYASPDSAFSYSYSKCSEISCMINPIFNIHDYENAIESIAFLLDSIQNPSIREMPYIEDLLNIYRILYLANEQMHMYSHEKFYLLNFSRRIEINQEYKFYKSSMKSIFKYTFVLPLSKKSEFITYENNILIKESLQETFFRALFEGEKSPYFFIKVDRKTIYEKTIKLLKNTSNYDLRKQVKVTFDNEEGHDQGGIKKEYFQLLSEKIRENTKLFGNMNGNLWFKLNTTSYKKEYEAIGKIIGVALYNNVVLNLPFPTLFFKRLLNKETELEDLRELDIDMYNSLNNILNHSSAEIEACGLTFEGSYCIDGVTLCKPLVKNGRKTRVDFNNAKSFVEKYCKFITNDSIEQQMKQVRNGFLSVIRPTSFEFLHARELEKIIVGTMDIDVAKLKMHSFCRDFGSKIEIIDWFWELFSECNSEKKKKLLQFITGNDRVPVTGNPVEIIILRNGCDSEHLPSAQTCFNILMIPEYSSKEKLSRKLTLAIDFTKGFYLV